MSTNIASHAGNYIDPTRLLGLVIAPLRVAWRAGFFLAIISCFCTVTALIALTVPGRRRQALLMSTAHFFAKVWNWGFNVKLSHSVQEWEGGTFLIVSNHLSYLDIPILAATLPCQFITSVEIKNTPFLGQICRLAACLFVERRDPSRISEEMNEIQMSLDTGLNVAIFPEGTSTNGEEILPFKKRLLNSALGTNAKILPVCINYRAIDGMPVRESNRDLVCWYGDMGFFRHFVNFLCLKSIAVELCIAPSFSTTGAEDHRYIAETSRQIIDSNFIPVRP